ncbi:ABC transporter permease [Victivallis sp. Marseille-Q1083]|uniref:ABC transporter permease n=1 Tax=Victivallis sp. Marseille-Q1083 TaxID=2717288 RepID=UPI00158EB11A|nr:ABC transporter permease [Victivallis sp. Marseille-Q1083]
MNSELFLAWRYLRPKRNALSIITILSILGVTLGVAVLMVVLAVMTGFTDEMKEKLLQTQAHLQIRSSYANYIANPQAAIDAVRAVGGEAAGVVQNFAMVQNGKRLLPKTVLGIDPADFMQRMKLGDVLRRGSFELQPGEIVVSETIAREMGLDVGRKLLLHSQERIAGMFNVDEDGSFHFKEEEVYLPMELKVAGIYSFDKYDFDSNILFLNRDDAAELFNMPWGAVSTVYGYVAEPFGVEKDVKALREKLPHMWIASWKDLNRQLLGVLAMEKGMMFYLLVFIVLVAAFSIANTLISSVYQKTREIGVLKALGAGGGQLMLIFILQGTFVGVVGNLLGFALGWSVIFWRNDILHGIGRLMQHDFFPKEIYFFSEMPAHIVPFDVALIFIASVTLCTLGAVIPALRAACLDPAKALRYE